MGLYLGKDKISALRTIEKTTQSMKAYLDAGGKCRENDAVSFEGCWQASDWENVTDLSSMFRNCKKLTTIPAMNTGNVTNVTSMFYDCYALTAIPQFDTSKVKNMSYMFYECVKLNTIPRLDTSNVVNTSLMFYRCMNLTTVPQLDMSKVTDTNGMFGYCSNIESIHMTGMKVSFSISDSTRFTRGALVEILNNLATVTTSPTLTMGSKNLAKLTDADKAIATGKGWKLA